jgi:hypothetical protein
MDPLSRHLLERWIYVLVLSDGEFIVPYTTSRQAALRANKEYGPDFHPFLEKFLAVLSGPDCRPGNYFPGGWYRALKAQGRDVATVEIHPYALEPFYGEEVHVDSRGRWKVGTRPVAGRVLEFLLRHLKFDMELARYLVRYRNVSYPETRYLRHESPPYRIRAIRFEEEGPLLCLNDGTLEPLRPETVRMNRHEALFCAVKPERLPAVFDDAARFQLMDRLEHGDGGYVLWLAKKAVPVLLEAQWEGADVLPA